MQSRIDRNRSNRPSSPWTPKRFSRHTLRVPCEVVRERDFRLVARHTHDISESGLLVDPLARVLTGEPVLVSFMAPFSRIWIDAEATVARVVHGRRRGDTGVALGLSFDVLDHLARALLRSALRDIPSAGPSRTFSPS